MYKRPCNLWAVIGLFLTLIQALCLGACSTWPAVPDDRDVRCVLRTLDAGCNDGYVLR